LLGIVLSLVVISQMAPVVIVMGLGICVLAVAWYLAYSRLHAREPSLVGSAIVAEAARRAGKPGELLDAYRIVVPVANPATQQQLLRVAAADAHTHKEARLSEIIALNVLKVPRQTSLEQNLRFERERIERQHELLEGAEAFATELGVNLRTRAIAGRDVAKTVLAVLEEERADEIFLGWRLERSTREHILGSTLDPILREAVCQVTLFHGKLKDIGSVVALAGPGPHSRVALRRAYEISLLGDEKPTFVNVQPPATRDEMVSIIDPQEIGEQTIHSIAEKAGLTEDLYTTRVLVNDNIKTAILAIIDDYDTVCFGMSTKNVFQRVLYGSLAARTAQAARGNVVMVRGPQERRWSIHEALIERFAKRVREPT